MSRSDAYNAGQNDNKLPKEWRGLAESLQKYLSFPTQAQNNKRSTTDSSSSVPIKVIQLSDSFGVNKGDSTKTEKLESMKNYWQRTFEEIRNLAVDPKSTPASPGNLFSQWKLFLENENDFSEDNDTSTTSADDVKVASNFSDMAWSFMATPALPRFEGFPSWERLLQDWADEVADYLEKAQVEPSEYPMSTFGKPTLSTSTSPTEKNKKQDWVLQDFADEVADYLEKAQVEPGEYPMSTFGKPSSAESQENVKTQELANIILSSPSRSTLESSAADPTTYNKTPRKRNKLPVPTPTKPGDAVLPHTDVAKKSKRILIVTTAALPWMTGTAVNPLLRAAYMTKGRKAAGGSVTLMLPWLERESDQERVYGKSKTFKTPEDQETYIRTWLRDTADMKQASEDLKFGWYTAWQNKVENSVYSMGDITALVAAEDVDICVLEEPEHLNW